MTPTRLSMPAIQAAYERGYRAGLKKAAEVAENPYSDAVAALGQDEPFAVGAKIAKALRRLAKP